MVVGSNIVSSNGARHLGVIFDKCIKLDYHISRVCKGNQLIFICVTLVAFVVFYIMMHVLN